MYADLIGNYKNYRIKSLQDNKVMAELADEELGSIVPSKIIKEEDIVTTQKVGYYIDENGYKRWGVIPMANNNLKSTWIPIEGPRSSDPRKWTINE